METITLRAVADENGVLRVELPAAIANKEYDLIVVMQPTADTVTDTTADDVPPDGTGARMAYEAKRANISYGPIIDGSQTDEILRNEFPDHLMRWMQDDTDDE